jgi:RNA polymerase sigma factor (TIGR02999 family)
MREDIVDGEITLLLHDWRAGDDDASKRLFTLVYRELKGIAMRRLARAGTRGLDATELVNETLLRLLGNAPDANSREHFFKIAATAIRCTLIDLIRHRQAEKRGGGASPLSLTLADRQAVTGRQWLDVEAALADLERHDPRKCRIVELAFLVGLNQREIADALAISLSTVERELRFAKAWLRERLST